jgi:hypothetical protein
MLERRSHANTGYRANRDTDQQGDENQRHDIQVIGRVA